ncbi:hypothetical protein [Flavobacterium limi]|uniref:Uncharacterized protein n=1 Tax=Flavobacterium limi TaxID=2045105 RepID=A0ABQ1USX5_9FLAO|nr:hypothetical protein [Flavobacterium limi]GGF24269.1 hypothetical protein GCM10011518_37000 [Flavobacterium limi]
MKKQSLFTLALVIMISTNLFAQYDSLITKPKKERLEFAKMYFEGGGIYTASFDGKKLNDNNQITPFKHSAAINSYLTWGAFHFWGHTELYVTFPLSQLTLNKNDQTDYQISHSVSTGARIYPWAMKEKKLRPYIGFNWGALDFKQKIKPNKNQPVLSKDFMLNYDLGLMYNYDNFGFRFSVNYFPDTKWEYPVSKTQMAEIKTPPLTFQVGLLYTYETSKENTKEEIEKWNSFPTVSPLSYGAAKFGDFFIGAGPSLSFSLQKSDYNKSQFPYLKQKLTSSNYFDISVGYQFNKANFFTALSFRNPKFETEGFGDKQTIKKTSFALEINKYLTDYTGFAPYIGVNLAYDKLKYEETKDGIKKRVAFSGQFEPGITMGWDIVPGKTDEVIVLRTNLRWYPFSEFEMGNKKINFSQLEYNLIQLVFYPERLKKKQ